MSDTSLAARLESDTHTYNANGLHQLDAIAESAIRSLTEARANLQKLRASGATGLGALIDEIAAALNDTLVPLQAAIGAAYDRETDCKSVPEQQPHPIYYGRISSGRVL